MRLSPGQLVLDRYQVEGLHDQGGMARVYRATNLKLGTKVALKVLTFEHDEELVERFNREAQMMARVHHPNVVQILDFGLVDGKLPCIAMEYVDGEPLDMRLVRRGALPWQEAVEVVLGILSGLDAIHAAGVLHRDLKPENIIVVPGEVEQPKLIDFGIALQEAAYDRKLTQVGETVGTPAYMSPEQLYGLPLDARSDVYSTSLVLYELVTQHLPNPGDATEALEMRVTNPLPHPVAPGSLPTVPDGLADAIFNALEPDPNNRPPSARAFANQLRRVRREARRNQALGQNPRPGAVTTPRTNTRENVPTPDTPFGAAESPPSPKKPAWKPPVWARRGAGGRSANSGPPTSPPSGPQTGPTSFRADAPSRPDMRPMTGPDSQPRMNRGPTTADLQARAVQSRGPVTDPPRGSAYGPWAKAAGLGRPGAAPRGGVRSGPSQSRPRSGPATDPPGAGPATNPPRMGPPSNPPRMGPPSNPPRMGPPSNLPRMGPPSNPPRMGPPSNPPRLSQPSNPPQHRSGPRSNPPRLAQVSNPPQPRTGASSPMSVPPPAPRPPAVTEEPASWSVADRLADMKAGGSRAAEHTASKDGVRNRLVIVAIVPKTKLRLPSEVRWLEGRCASFGRGVTVAGKFFICNVKAASKADAEASATVFRDALVERYAPEGRASWAEFTDDVGLSPDALPPVAQGLMHYMTTMG